MSEYTVHVQLPDTVIGTLLFDLTFEHPDVTTAILRSGHGTWLSFGVNAEFDSEAIILADKIRMNVSQATGVQITGYEYDSLMAFEHAPMIMTNGRCVVHSVGV